MPKRRTNDAQILFRLPASLRAWAMAVLEDGETIGDLLRTALLRELGRRDVERKQVHVPPTLSK